MQCSLRGKVSKGPEETLQSHQASMAGGHSSLRCFEAPCKFPHISVLKEFEGRTCHHSSLSNAVCKPMLEMLSEGLQVSHHISAMDEEPHADLLEAAALCTPESLPPSPFLTVFIIHVTPGPGERPQPTRVVRGWDSMQVWRLGL